MGSKDLEQASTVVGPTTGPTSSTSTGPGGETDLRPGEAVGEYVVDAVIGRGGFGTVYRASHPLIGKQVAIKVLARRYSSDEAIVSRFIAEARAVNQIRHRHIIDIFSFGTLPDGRAYYVMEYVDGQPLDSYLAQRGALTLAEALPIFGAIARALDAAHAKGIAHRDLKPENIYLARDDEGTVFPKLLDFGIAKLLGKEEAFAHKTNTGVPIGTPYYMSPEQCRGRDVDHRTDIYAFGVLAYRVLTGTFPFQGEMVEILHQHMHEPVPPPSSRHPGVSLQVDRAIAWMLSKDPADRPKSLASAVAALQGERTPAPSQVPLVAVPAMSPRPGRGTVAIVLGVLVVAGTVMAVLLGGSAPTPAPPVAVEVAAPPVDAALATPDAPLAAAPPVDAALSKLVDITVTGVPPDIDVLVGGKPIGKTPTVQLERGARRVQLVLKVPGHLTASQWVVPDEDRSVNVKLVKRPKRPGRDDIFETLPGSAP